MQISKQKSFSTVINFVIGFFFLSLLAAKGAYNWMPFFCGVLGIGYSLFLLTRKTKLAFSKNDKWIICCYVFYFAVFLISLFIHKGNVRELDNPSRALVFIPVLILLLQIRLLPQVLIYCIPLGAIIAGGIAIYDRFVSQVWLAFSPRIMHIQGGDIAMSLGIFSLVLGFYSLERKMPKTALLCFSAVIFGIIGSLFSGARGGWIGLPLFIIFSLWFYRHYLSKKFFIGAISIFILAGIGAAQTSEMRVMERFNQAKYDITSYLSGKNTSTSLGARFDMWKGAVLMIKEKPILGWGVKGYQEKQTQQVSEGTISEYAGTFKHAHNQYLDVLTKYGLLGILALLGVFILPLRIFIQGLKTAGNSTVKMTAILGIMHIISAMTYCLSQSFFNHNSGNIFYFFLVIVFYAMMRTEQQRAKHE